MKCDENPKDRSVLRRVGSNKVKTLESKRITTFKLRTQAFT